MYLVCNVCIPYDNNNDLNNKKIIFLNIMFQTYAVNADSVELLLYLENEIYNKKQTSPF